MKRLAAIGLLLGACSTAEKPMDPVFDCPGSVEDYRLYALDGGSFALEIRAHKDGPVGSSTWHLDWTDVRTGFVVGQQGGHQGHLRLTDGKVHYIFYEGVDGQLADRPGRTYAGVSYLAGPVTAEPVPLAECAATDKNRALLETVRAGREMAGLPELREEDANGPFDGWF